MFRRVLAIFVFVVANAMAPQMANAQEISPEHLALAKKYVEMTDTTGVYQRTILATAQESVDYLVQQNPEIGESIVIGAREVAEAYFKGENRLHDAYARIYASHYSADELTEIVAFYESAVGQKILKSNVDVNKSLRISAGLLETNLATEFASRLRSNLKDKGFDL